MGSAFDVEMWSMVIYVERVKMARQEKVSVKHASKCLTNGEHRVCRSIEAVIELAITYPSMKTGQLYSKNEFGQSK